MVELAPGHLLHKAEPAVLAFLPAHIAAHKPRELKPELLLAGLPKFQVAEETRLPVWVEPLLDVGHSKLSEPFQGAPEVQRDDDAAQVKDDVPYHYDDCQPNKSNLFFLAASMPSKACCL